MIAAAAGLALLALFLWAANAFARADVATVKALLTYVAAGIGLCVAALLLLTERGAAATSGLVLVAPLAMRLWKGAGAARAAPRARPSSRMSRAEALAVLGLAEGATEADIREAWLRMMRAVHPDSGGSDFLATQVNQAKDVLLPR